MTFMNGTNVNFVVVCSAVMMQSSSSFLYRVYFELYQLTYTNDLEEK